MNFIVKKYTHVYSIHTRAFETLQGTQVRTVNKLCILRQLLRGIEKIPPPFITVTAFSINFGLSELRSRRRPFKKSVYDSNRWCRKNGRVNFNKNLMISPRTRKSIFEKARLRRVPRLPSFLKPTLIPASAALDFSRHKTLNWAKNVSSAEVRDGKPVIRESAVNHGNEH